MSTDFIAQFGSKFVNPSNEYAEVTPKEALEGKDNVLIYFSAHWCPPCRAFTPILCKLYKKLKDEGKNFELVFASFDREEDEYKEYTSEMPWLCLPFKADESQKLGAKYKASGIPHLVVLDGEGKVITMDGTSKVREEENGENFPWVPKSFKELFDIDNVLISKGEGDDADTLLPTSELKDKYLMLYFSAHWCPPCKMFTPKLSKAYTKLKAERSDFELLFVSSDRSEEDFNAYFKTMSFGAVPFERRDIKKELSSRYGVSGIPMLIMLGPEDENGERPLINDGVRGFIESDALDEFPFHKKNYGDVENGAEELGDSKVLVIFCENGDDEEQDNVKFVAKAVAEKLKEKDGDDAMSVFYSLSHKGIGPRIRQLAKLPAPESAEDASMIILDIPDNGGYYKSDETDITIDAVMDFISNPGNRQQLE